MKEILEKFLENYRSLRNLGRVLRRNLDIVWATLFAILAILCAHWAAVRLEEIVDRPSHSIGWGLVFLVLSVAFTLLVWWYRHAFRALRCPLPTLSEHARKECLVFFVSDQYILDKDVVTLKAGGGFLVTGSIPPTGSLKLGKPPTQVPLPRASLETEIALLDPLKWNWQQILRGLKPHVEPAPSGLKRVYLVGSAPAAKSEGTQTSLETCKNFIAPYLPGVDIIPWPTAVDFEDVVELDESLRRIVKDGLRKGHDQDRICIDVTGGQKPASIAGAIATLNSPVTIQYVQTFSKDPKLAFIYDLRFLAPAESPEAAD